MAPARVLAVALAAAYVEGCSALNYYKDGVLVELPTLDVMRMAHSRELMATGAGSNTAYLAAKADKVGITHGGVAAVTICMMVVYTIGCIGGTYIWDRKTFPAYLAEAEAEKEAQAQAKKANQV